MTHSGLQTDDLRCVFCFGPVARAQDGLSCKGCNTFFPKFRNAFFIGAYAPDDALGLMEVASKVTFEMDIEETRRNRQKAETNLEKKYREQRESAAAPKHQAAAGSSDMAQSVRFNEWVAFHLLTENVDLAGKKVLDNGAGLGGDTIRLTNRGAHVTCLDFNPVAVDVGRQLVPEARWLIATSNTLPFEDDAFDVSVANAALHHMHDFRRSFREMLRVTRPGGTILLVSDPFMDRKDAPDQREKEELRIFAEHPMVLNGVNEGVLPINEYYECVSLLEDARILTSRINDPAIGNTPTFWSVSDATRDKLYRSRGNISAIGTVPHDKSCVRRTADDLIDARAFFETIGSPIESAGFLVRYMDNANLDRAPKADISKFDLLNGWMPAETEPNIWRAYNRGRLFYSADALRGMTSIRIKRHDNGADHAAQVAVLLNGKEVKSEPVTNSRWMQVIPQELGQLQDRNVLEIAIKDDKFNKGAIWGELNRNRILEVEFK